MNFLQEALLCQAVSNIEAGLRAVRPLLPARIAKLEAQAPQLASPHGEACEHMARAEKIVLFCANELHALYEALPPEVVECLKGGAIQLARVREDSSAPNGDSR